LGYQKKMLSQKFNKPIGKWINEEEDVERVVRSFDPVARKITEETKVEKQKVKVIYEKPTIDGMFCPEFTHEFRIIDSHKYIIKCKKCPLHKHISVGNEYIDSDGHVRLRNSDTIIA